MKVARHLCVGCGVCGAACPAKRIAMPFDRRAGHYQPSQSAANCDKKCGICEKVCPFVASNASTAEVSGSQFAAVNGIQHQEVLGYYLSTWLGFSQKHRARSASGGLATWMLETLLASGEIDGAICVGPNPSSPTLFGFRVCRSIEEIQACSSSCYQPVEISSVLEQVLNIDSRYALTALPCLAKAVRLAMQCNPKLRNRMRYIIGLTCGQALGRQAIEYNEARWLQGRRSSQVTFRYKDGRSACGESITRFRHANEWREVSWSRVGFQMSMFKLQACDYCDDVFAECADVVLMDAWLANHGELPYGTSLAVVRNQQLQRLLSEAEASGTVQIKNVSPTDVIQSQLNVDVIRKKRLLSYCNQKQAALLGRQTPALRASKRPDVCDHVEALAGRMRRTVISSSWYHLPGNTQAVQAAEWLFKRTMWMNSWARRIMRKLRRSA